MKPGFSMPGTARSILVTSWPASSSALMTTGPTPRSHEPVPPVTATFIVSIPVRFVPHRAVDEVGKIGMQRRAVEIGAGHAGEAARERAVLAIGATFVGNQRGIEQRPDGLPVA